MCAPPREKSNFRLNWWFSFYIYILEVLTEEAIKFPFMERESCDYDVVVGKVQRKEEAFNNELLPKLKHPFMAVKKGRGRFEYHIKLNESEEICRDNSSNNKIWWCPLPGDGTSEDMVAVMLAIKQKINIKRLLRSAHALFRHSDKFLLVLTKNEQGMKACIHSSSILISSFWQKMCEEDRLQITDGILNVSKQLKTVP